MIKKLYEQDPDSKRIMMRDQEFDVDLRKIEDRRSQIAKIANPRFWVEAAREKINSNRVRDL